MITTIGSLVQETSNRYRWLIASGIYIIACSSTSVLLGILLGALGQFIQTFSSDMHMRASVFILGSVLVTTIAIAYAFSDVGVMSLPRPRLMYAVPATWWRSWKPYGAALAYGATLGVGITTQIQFGAFYGLCLWCIVKGNIAYGASLMGVYGAARSLTLLPTSCGIYYCQTNSHGRLKRLLASIGIAKLSVAIISVLFATQVLVSLFF